VVLDVCSLRHLARSYGQKAETIDNRSVLRKFNQSISLDKVTTVHAYSKVGITRHLERCKCTKTSVRERADTTFTLRYKSHVFSLHDISHSHRRMRLIYLMHLKLACEPKILIETIHGWNTDTTMYLAQVFIYVFCSLVLGEAKPAYMCIAHPTMHMVATSRFLNPYMTRRTRLGSVA